MYVCMLIINCGTPGEISTKLGKHSAYNQEKNTVGVSYP